MSRSVGDGPHRSRLSVFDLPMFFEPHHFELGEQLEAFNIDDQPAADVIPRLAAAGLLNFLFPSSGRLDVRALCLIRERLGAVAPAADSIFAVQGLGTTPLRLAQQQSTDAGLEELLARAAAGVATFGFALTESEAGSDVASIATRAVMTDGAAALTGHKTLISNVGIATHYTVFASTRPGSGHRGISAFVVDSGHAGVTNVPMEVIGDHPIGSIEFEQAPALASVGAAGTGFKLAMQTLDRFRVTVGAAAVGMARAAFDAAFDHVHRRQQFGAPLAEKQLVQAHLADMVTDIDAARLLVFRAAHLIDSGPVSPSARLPGQGRVAQAKLFATEAAQRVIDRAVQLFGGRGVTAGETVEKLYRAIRPLRIYEGASDIQRLVIYADLVRRHAAATGA